MGLGITPFSPIEAKEKRGIGITSFGIKPVLKPTERDFRALDRANLEAQRPALPIRPAPLITPAIPTERTFREMDRENLEQQKSILQTIKEPTSKDLFQNKSLGEVFGESFRRGVLRTGSAIETILSVGAKKIGAEQLSIKLQKLSEQDTELSKVGINVIDTRKFQDKIKDPKFIAQGIGETLPTLLFGIGVAIPAAVVGAPALVVSGAAFAGTATLEAGFAYQDAKEFGADEQTAQKTAGIVGVANGILEAIPITKLLTRSVVGKNIKRKIIAEITKRVVRQAGLESGTESLQEIVSNSVATVYDENRKLLAGVPESAFFGGIIGSGVQTIADVAPRIRLRGLQIEEVKPEKNLIKIPPEDLALKKNVKTEDGYSDILFNKKTGEPIQDVSTSPEAAKVWLKEGYELDTTRTRRIPTLQEPLIEKIEKPIPPELQPLAQEAPGTMRALANDTNSLMAIEKKIQDGITPTVSEQGLIKTTGQTLQEFTADALRKTSLGKEARKYESAEDLFQAQQGEKLFTGGTEGIRNFKLPEGENVDSLMYGKGIYLTPDRKLAEGYGRGGEVYEVVADIKNPLTPRNKDWFQFIQRSNGEQKRNWLIKNGYDAVVDNTGKYKQVMVVNPEQIKTKQQFVDAFYQSKLGTTIPKELEPMAKIARESKTHDEFIRKFKADELGNFCIDI